MPDQDTWRFINTFAPWFSAFGTVSAVIVSLYLARRSARPTIRVSAAIVQTIPSGQLVSGEFFQIRVVNPGFREVTVSGIMWKQLGWRRQNKQTYVVFPPADPYSTRLPAKLEYGDQAHFFFPVDTFPKLGKHLLATLTESSASSFRLRMLRVGVYASTGEEFMTSLEPSVRKWLVNQAKSVSV